jgi:hypothetical protein
MRAAAVVQETSIGIFPAICIAATFIFDLNQGAPTLGY